MGISYFLVEYIKYATTFLAHIFALLLHALTPLLLRLLRGLRLVAQLPTVDELTNTMTSSQMLLRFLLCSNIKIR